MSSIFDNGGYIGVTADFNNPFQSTDLNIIQDNLILRLDPFYSESYSGSGTTWFDLSDENNNGTLTNGPVYNDNYFEFDGDNDFVDFGSITTSNPLQLSAPSGGGLTLMFALYWDGTGDSYQRIIDKSNSGNAANGWAVYPLGTPSGQLVFQFNSGTQVTINSGVIPAISAWEIWAFTYNSSTGAWVWYKNGISINTGTQSYTIPSVETNMRIGSWNHDVAREWNGRIGTFLIYEKPLNSTEILHNYNMIKGRYGL